MKVSHIITGLGAGGAENMLLKVLAHQDNAAIRSEVISLTGAHPIGPLIEQLGVPVVALNMAPGRLSPPALRVLAQRLRRHSPDVVQTWMHHADLVGGLTARAVTCAPVVWGLRGSVEPHASKRHSRATVAVAARLSSRVPEVIVSCSQRLVEEHARLGYDRSRMVVIPNGFDLTRFGRHPEAARALTAELGLPPETPLVGLIGRWDPQKDHGTFLAAAWRVKREHSSVHFVFCGGGMTPDNGPLVELIADAGLTEHVALLGRREDVPLVTAALCLATSSSAFGEGFSNTLGEAMASEVPCVATDVGDASMIIEATGWVVPPRDGAALGAAILAGLRLQEADRRALGRAARRRIHEGFEISAIARRYEDVWASLT